MKVIIGLGNPGRAYRYTRHNVGFLVIERLAKENKIKVRLKKYGSLAGRGKVAGEDVLLAMPVTYMNLSGKAVREAIDEEGATEKDLLVVCDDINLRLGTIRVKTKGSAGGHKGLASVIGGLGSDEFTRVRVGIATEVLRGDITDYVLSPFKKKDLKKMREVVEFAKDAISLWVKDGPEAAMNKYNVRNRTYG